MISENIIIIDNEFPDNVEILRKQYDQEGELKHVHEEKDIAVAHTMNLNKQYDNAQAKVSGMEYDQIKL